MATDQITDARQQLLDQFIADVHARRMLGKARRGAMVALIRLHTPNMDVWNSRRLGFRELVTLGMGVHLGDLVNEFVEQYGGPGARRAYLTTSASHSFEMRWSPSAPEARVSIVSQSVRPADARHGWVLVRTRWPKSRLS